MKELFFSVNGIKYSVESQFLTGTQIKEIANVPEEYELYLVIPEYQDELINNNTRVNMARPGIERFEARKPTSGEPVRIIIIVNTNHIPYNEPKITYEQVVTLAFGSFDTQIGYTVVYSHGPRQNLKGKMAKGTDVFVKNNMQFNVGNPHKS